MPILAPEMQVTPGKHTQSARPRLHFLDGVRGFAAFSVMLHHIWQMSFIRGHATANPLWFRALSAILKQGHYLVAVFIVLSGFCLMLPVAQANGVMKGGFWSYLQRRARRILPPYYICLVLATALLALVPAIRVDDGTIYNPYHRADMPGSLISHLLMAHNLIPNWAHRIDGPMWSVATEWQIYFLFPLVLLPVWRRWGSIAPVVLGLAIGFCTIGTFLETACFWYAGLFAMGMAACAVCFAPPETKNVRPWSWPRLWGALALATLAAIGVGHKFHSLLQPCFDVVLGILTGYLLIYCTRQAADGGEGALPRLFSSRPLVSLGIFSYSLYLIHYPLLLLMKSLLLPHRFSDPVNFGIYLALGAPIILGVSYLFHRAFERPFMHVPSVKTH